MSESQHAHATNLPAMHVHENQWFLYPSSWRRNKAKTKAYVLLEIKQKLRPVLYGMDNLAFSTQD